MAYNIKVVDNTEGISFDAKRQGIKGTPIPVPLPFSPEGQPVKRKSLQKSTLTPVDMGYFYVDANNKVWEKKELIWKLGEEEVGLSEMTSVFTIIEYRPLLEYTDYFNIEDYQEFDPDTSDKDTKKDDIPRIKANNMVGMKRLWDKLHSENCVAAGEFYTTSGSTKGSTALIRAISKMVMTEANQLSNKWGLEMGICKEEKIFNFLYEGEPIAAVIPQTNRVRSGLLRRA